VTYPSRELEQVLSKTLGVPLFQEQAMKIAIVAANFTPTSRSASPRHGDVRKNGTIHQFEAKLIEGMVANGYERDFAERCFHQMRASAITAFPKAMRRASRCSPISRPG